jgi:hypothetical protein
MLMADRVYRIDCGRIVEVDHDAMLTRLEGT